MTEKVTDEELMEALKTIKKYCTQTRNCKCCLMANSDAECAIGNSDIVAPDEWDLTIRRVIF